VPDGRPAELDGLEQITCTECHREIVEEWATTTHALALVDEIYQEHLKDRRKPETCHACHAPEPLHGAELAWRPDARSEGRHFGVSCESCHLGPEGVMLGPRGLAAPDAHPSARSDTMVGIGSNDLCSACHRTTVGPVIGLGKDFENSDQALRGRTCVGCHLHTYQREDGTTARSHLLQTPRDPAFLRRAFEIEASAVDDTTIVTISNATGHRVPGLVGRDLKFVAALLGADGQTLATGELELTTRVFLPVDASVQISLDGVGSRVRLTGDHVDPRLEEPVRFLEEDLVP
jgi:hypothetical protein